MSDVSKSSSQKITVNYFFIMPAGRPVSKFEISLNDPNKSIITLKQLSKIHGNKIKIELDLIKGVKVI